MDIGIKLPDYRRTLAEASWDDSAKISLVDSPLPVCKLDSLSKTVCRKLRGGVTLAGCDAFLESDGIYWFVEFKNQYARNIDKAEIQKKAYDSISMVRMAVNQEITLRDLCRNAVFLVVYRDDEMFGEDDQNAMFAKFAGESPVRWGLDRIEGILYKTIRTIPKSKFCETWLPRMRGMESGGNPPPVT